MEGLADELLYLSEADLFDHTPSVSTRRSVSNQEGLTKRTLSDLTDDLIAVHNT